VLLLVCIFVPVLIFRQLHASPCIGSLQSRAFSLRIMEDMADIRCYNRMCLYAVEMGKWLVGSWELGKEQAVVSKCRV
jgi:hypothetical protein